MPKSHHVESLPDEVAAAVTAFGSEPRVGILMHLLRSGPSTSSDLSAALGIPHSTIAGNIAPLERVGAIAASIPAGQRTGRSVVFTASRDTVRSLAESLRAALVTAGDPTHSDIDPPFSPSDMSR